MNITRNSDFLKNCAGFGFRATGSAFPLAVFVVLVAIG